MKDKFYELEQQRLEILINSKGGGSAADPTMLPFDPSDPPDSSSDPNVIATNWLDNSDFDFSKDAYLNATPVGGDAAEEVFNWYRQRFIKVTDAVISGAPSTNVQSPSGPFQAAYTYPMDFVLVNGASGGEALAGTLTRVDDNNATLSAAAQNNIPSGGVLWFGDALAESSANAVKSAAHSLYAASEGANARIPRWDKTNGWLEFGSDTADRFDLASPLGINFIRPGVTWYFRCIVRLRSGATAGDPIRIGVGIWDATASEKRFIESSNMDLTAVAVGTAGATTYEYVVIADNDDGTSVVTDTVSVATGPAALSSSDYIRLTWVNTSGILRFRIYRKVGGVTKRVFTVTNGGQDFNDTGADEGETLSDLPSAGVTRPLAYKVSEEFTPGDAWQAVLIPLPIPSTYDTAATTGKQWCRISVEGGPGGTERHVLIDRVMLSTSNGGWQRSQRDFNKVQSQSPSSTPPGSDQGDTGIVRPPYCFALDTPVVVCERDGAAMREVPIGEIEPGMYVAAGSSRVNRVERIVEGTSRKMVDVTLSNGVRFRCTPTHRFITSRADLRGTRICDLTRGDEILCWRNGWAERSTIATMRFEELDTPETVRTLTLKPGKTFVAGASKLLGAVTHNRKAEDDLGYYLY
jgi:hypothetical protein